MKLRMWQRIWIVAAGLLLFFPAVFITIEMPTETRIYGFWSQQMIWKTHNEVASFNGLGPWAVRRKYDAISDRELVAVLPTKYPAIDYSAINRKYRNQLATLIHDQWTVVLEASGVYLLVIAILYGIGWTLAWILGPLNRGEHNPRSRNS